MNESEAEAVEKQLEVERVVSMGTPAEVISEGASLKPGDSVPQDRIGIEPPAETLRSLNKAQDNYEEYAKWLGEDSYSIGGVSGAVNFLAGSSIAVLAVSPSMGAVYGGASLLTFTTSAAIADRRLGAHGEEIELAERKLHADTGVEGRDITSTGFPEYVELPGGIDELCADLEQSTVSPVSAILYEEGGFAVTHHGSASSKGSSGYEVEDARTAAKLFEDSLRYLEYDIEGLEGYEEGVLVSAVFMEDEPIEYRGREFPSQFSVTDISGDKPREVFTLYSEADRGQASRFLKGLDSAPELTSHDVENKVPEGYGWL